MNAKVIEEINEIFERMHAKLDYRFQQLIRQVNRKSKFESSLKKKINLKSFFYVRWNDIEFFSDQSNAIRRKYSEIWSINNIHIS